LSAAGNIHNFAYLSIGVTSSSGRGAERGAYRGNFRGSGPRLCSILHVNFGECPFHALG
jgi:hypothetical protein